MKLLFLARIAGPFSGRTIYQGNLGGSESALVYISRELAKRGHQVVVVSRCPDSAGFYEGVQYENFTSLKNFTDFTRRNDFDVFLALRDIEVFLCPVKAKIKVWLGPDDFSRFYQKSFLLNWLGSLIFRGLAQFMKKKVNCFFTVSRWQKETAQKYTGLPDDYFFVTKNGVNFDYFKNQNVTREKYRLIYTSVPERGLDTLLEIFLEIKKEIPGAELYVFGCFDYWRRSQKQDSKIFGLLYEKAKNTRGVHLMGAVKQSQLAQELLRSRLMVYPSHPAPKFDFFAETSCIAALEAQAAGTPVMASATGALTETVQDGRTGILIKGAPFSQKFKEDFVRAGIDLLKDEACWQVMSEQAQKWVALNYQWSDIAAQWEEKFKELLKNAN